MANDGILYFSSDLKGNQVWTTLKQDMNIISLVLVLGAAVRMCVAVLTTLQSPFGLISSTCVFVILKLGFNQRVLDLAMTLKIVFFEMRHFIQEICEAPESLMIYAIVQLSCGSQEGLGLLSFSSADKNLEFL